MKTNSFLMLMLFYIIAMVAFAITMISRSEAYMDHSAIMQGFIHAQKAPQMGRPMIYLPAKKVFKGKKHKKHKGKPYGEQRFGRKKSNPVPTPLPTGTPSGTPIPASSANPTPGHGSSDNSAIIIRSGEVDLRSRDSFIKDQIDPICTAYAGAAGIENLLGKGVEDLSERHIFSMYGEYSVDAFANGVPGHPIALNSAWTRENKSPNQGYLSTAKHELLKIDYLGDGEIEAMKKSLQSGHPVYLGVEVPADMASCLASIRPTSKVTSGGHAILIVGYKDDVSNNALGGGYFTIKNSWSDGCGDHGYQYIPYSYCDKSYCYMYEMSKAQ